MGACGYGCVCVWVCVCLCSDRAAAWREVEYGEVGVPGLVDTPIFEKVGFRLPEAVEAAVLDASISDSL